MASAAKSEVGTLFVNAQDTIPVRTTLIKLGYPHQPPTPILETDNYTAMGIVNNSTIKQKLPKAMGMCCYWLKDCKQQGQFRIFWWPSTENLGDYHTRYHPTSHHRLMSSTYLLTMPPKKTYLNALQGCVNSPPSVQSYVVRLVGSSNIPVHSELHNNRTKTEPTSSSPLT